MKYEVLGPVASFGAGQVVEEGALTGCNVAALLSGGFLREVGGEAELDRVLEQIDPVSAAPVEATPIHNEGALSK